MQMTHYMELLATNQPWNLILFMAIPVILAETVAITELVILFRGEKSGGVGALNRFAGTFVGWYFLGVFLYLFTNVVIPLTMTGGWRGLSDIIAVGFYLLGVIPLFGLALVDMNVLLRNKSEKKKLKLHAFFVGVFLVVAHIAMIFGMLNPSVLGYQENMPMSNTQMEKGQHMENMDMSGQN